MVVPVGSTTLSGLGCDCSIIDEAGDCVDPESCSSGSTTLNLPGFNNVTPPLFNVYSGLPTATPVAPNSTVSTGMSPSQLALLSQITANAGTIGKELALSPGVSVGANGTVSQQNPGFPIAGTNSVAALSGQFSGMLPLVVLAVAGFALINMSKR